MQLNAEYARISFSNEHCECVRRNFGETKYANNFQIRNEMSAFSPLIISMEIIVDGCVMNIILRRN